MNAEEKEGRGPPGKEKAPYLSIIVLAYQVAPYLEQCLSSLVNQSFTDFEVLLVDDGSTDGSGAICDAFAARDSRIQAIHQKNAGIAMARRAGLERARGIYLGAVDGDDWVERDMFAELCAAAAESDADIVQCNATGNYPRRRTRIEIAGLSPGVYRGEEYRRLIGGPLTGESLAGSRLFFNSLCNKIIRRELLIRAFSGMGERCVYGEDAACSLFCAAWAGSLVHIDRRLYHYRQRLDSATHRFSPSTYDDIFALWAFMLSRRNEFDDHVGRQMDLVALRLLVMAFGADYVYSTDAPSVKRRRMAAVVTNAQVREALRALPLSSQFTFRRRRLLAMMKCGLPPLRGDVTLPPEPAAVC